MGPAAVVLTMQGPWVLGVLANQQWSVAGDSARRGVSQLLIQPFVNYNLPDGFYLTSSPVITANWMADSGNQWTVPLGGGFGKLWRVGKVGLSVNTNLSAYYNLEKPQDAADWSLRFQVQVLLPNQEGTVSQAKASAQAYLIQTNEPTTFAIDLKTMGAEVRNDLVYQYWGGGDSGMGFRGGGGGTQRQQNMARDVCAGLAP
jgi:hypothetical protein